MFVISGFNRLTLIGRQGATVVDDSGGAAQTFLVVDSTDVYFQTLGVDGGLVGGAIRRLQCLPI